MGCGHRFDSLPVFGGYDLESVRQRVWIIAHHLEEIGLIKAVEVDFSLGVNLTWAMLKAEVIPEAERPPIEFVNSNGGQDSFDLGQSNYLRCLFI